MIIFMNLYKTKGVLGSWKLWFSYINEKKNQNQNFSSFSADFGFRAEGEKATSRAELKILQLVLWLKPAWLGLITSYGLFLCRQSDLSKWQLSIKEIKENQRGDDLAYKVGIGNGTQCVQFLSEEAFIS